ncbi:TerS [Enterococcus gallinarum]|uniref:phage terminase small subunit n=1 Tax=Enterococcus gallinarum TaxID=1353 RepID=UPI001AD754BE|nr:phage terminase small subunit [Enterococcus gallinarum]MBO6330596.1 TerS [Enterococcus gallinarum]MBO6351720.1 TerS [Enterococcus gallinarum]MBO6394374.1 TerS [Enterococcus gallinarum]MBO6425363.1 TerS [Enterococcus gallinarum]
MARKRNPLRDEAYRIWIESNKQKALKDIADELGVSASTVRKWKSEDKWDGETKRSAPNEKERYDSLRGNNNAKDNRGGAPPDNKNAVSHGLFANWLPDDTRQIIQELYTSEPSDILWNNIMIQYTAIIRSQKILNVQSEFDHTEDVVSAEVNPMFVDKETGKLVQTKVTRQFQYAWEKQASFLNAQSRAMGTLSNLIKQFIAVSDERDERRLKLQLMSAQIDNLRAKNKDGSEEFDMEDDGFLAALEAEGEELWPEE